tara:strand:+ start:41 stop:445 length:405 start_codon:yes stop_codon:yes gene_type:complete
MIENNSYTKIKISNEKNFGFLFSFVFFLISIYPLISDKKINLIFLIISIIIFFISLFRPKLFYYPNIIWFKLGLFLGSIISPLVMGIIFFLVVFPTGLVMRIFKKDILDQKINSSKNSYWKNKVDLNNSFKNQF